jgi:hypothetical protein
MVEALNEKPKQHPLLNAMQFIDDTKGGGASLNVKTGENAKLGSSNVILVGGEKDTSGKRVPTAYYGKTRKGSSAKAPEMGLTDVLKERARVNNLTGGRKNVFMGSWVSDTEPHKGVQVDASAGFSDPNEAMKALKDRNEEAGFNLKTGEEVKNPSYNPKGKKK